MKKTLFKFILVLLFISIFGIVYLFSYQDSYSSLKYYKSFEYHTTDNQSKTIKFKNQLDYSNVKGQWYLAVYFNEDGQVLKIKNYDKNGNLYETITDTLDLKVEFE